MITLLLTLLVTNSHANEFEQHSVPTSAMTCKKIDYSSYFVAQQSEKSIKDSNPEVSKPNFAGKFIILKNELMMETVWLIADCETGKILHEKLTGRQAEFKPDSALLIIRADRKEPEYQLWVDGAWTKTDAPVAATPTPTPGKDGKAYVEKKVQPISSSAVVVQKSVLDQYDSFFKKFAVAASPAMTCKKLDYGSYFKAQQAKDNMVQLNKDVSHPNFAGHYLLLKNEVLFETLWLIADCETGKFFPTLLNGKATFKPDSALALVRTSGDYSELSVWLDLEWLKIADSTRETHPSVKNMLYGSKAKTLFEALPHKERETKTEFDQIVCQGQGPTQTCTVDLFKKPKTPIEPRFTTALNDLIRLFGQQIELGNCEVKSGEPQCQITVK